MLPFRIVAWTFLRTTFLEIAVYETTKNSFPAQRPHVVVASLVVFYRERRLTAFTSSNILCLQV